MNKTRKAMDPPLGVLAATWFVTMLVAGKRFAALDYDDPIIEGLEDLLASRAGFVSADPEGLLITVGSDADPTEAVDDAVGAVRCALAAVRAGRAKIEVIRLTRAQDTEHALISGESPPDFYSLADVAKRLGVTRQRASVMHKTGKLPDPACTVGKSPGFSRTEIEELAQKRN